MSGLLWLLCLAALGAEAEPPALPRGFTLSTPLFHGASAWNQDATAAGVLPGSDAQILVTYRVLCGDNSNQFPLDDLPNLDWPFPDVGYDEFTMPIFAAGSAQQSVDICDYDGNQGYPGSRWLNNVLGGPITIPACSGTVRPSAPVGAYSDGQLILYDQATGLEYDFWQATTVRDGVCQSHGGGLTGTSIPEVGAADWFDVSGDGSNPNGESSARAMGTALLAGMILPEDVASGTINHALALAIPGPRNLSPDPGEPLPSDYHYPAATTETDYYSTNLQALAAGQRLRLTDTIVDDTGSLVDESRLTPITHMLLTALRSHGAYVVENAGGFTFVAEDITTAVLDLSLAEVNALIGEAAGEPFPAGKTKWQLVMEVLNEELWEIPVAYGTCSGAASTVTTANFEVVEPAVRIILMLDGFEIGDTRAWSAAVSD